MRRRRGRRRRRRRWRRRGEINDGVGTTTTGIHSYKYTWIKMCK